MKDSRTVGSHTLRRLSSQEDYAACVTLQEEVWGAGFSERVPMAILKVGQEVGGVSAGAFDADGRLDGFVFGLTGIDAADELLHWSDMLAVRPGVRGQGLAAHLKSFQRDMVLGRGVRRMAWTFDPLRAGNGYLNLTKLGAVVRDYREDMYGETDSALHRGIGTDRFVALWLLDSARVRDRLARALEVGRKGAASSPDSAVAALEAETDPISHMSRPLEPRLDLEAPSISVAIPTDIGAIMERDPELALAWRRATREILRHYLALGYEVREVIPAGAGHEHARYLLERRDTDPIGRAPAQRSSKGSRV